jgi:hypothetical protein
LEALNIFFFEAIEEEKARGVDAHTIFPKAEHLSGSVINQLIFGYIFTGVGELICSWCKI